MPNAASRNGTAMPAEYATSKSTPRPSEPLSRAKVNTAPSTGPTHGAQPAEKKTPIKPEEM